MKYVVRVTLFLPKNQLNERELLLLSTGIMDGSGCG